MSLNPKDAKCAVAKQNPKKNRSLEFLPGNWHGFAVHYSRVYTYFELWYVFFCSNIHTSASFLHTVDKWRVVLKGETPDYINATNVHVSNSQYISGVYHHHHSVIGL